MTSLLQKIPAFSGMTKQREIALKKIKDTETKQVQH